MGTQSISQGSTGVKIQYRGFPPVPVNGSLLMMAVLLFAGIYLTLVVQGLFSKVPEGWFLRFDWLWRIVIAFLIMASPLFLIGYVALRLCFADTKYWKSVEWDQDGKRFLATQAGVLQRKRIYERGLDEIWRMEAYVGAEGNCAVAIHLTILCDEQDDVDVDLAIDEVNRRDEALDVLFTIARASGMAYYSVDNVDVDTMIVTLMPVAGEEESLPIPKPIQSPRYDLDRVSTSITVPAPKVSSFDSQSFQHPEMRVTAWKPGKEIRIDRPPASLVAMLVVGIAVSIAAWLVGLPGLWLPCAAFFVGAIVYRLLNHEYEFVVDWNSGVVSWRREWLTRAESLHHIDCLVLRGVEKWVHRKKGRGYPTYRCQVEVQFHGGRRVRVIDNGAWSTCGIRQRRQLEPMIAALAEALDRPWRWVAYDQPSVRRSVDNAMGAAILVGIIGVLGFFGYGVWLQSRISARYAAISKQIEATGATVLRTGIDVGKENIFGDGFLITVSDPEFGDDDLKSLLGLLIELSLYGLDLSGTSITDEALSHFVERPSMFLLFARKTRLTRAAAMTLAKTNIQCLDVRDTAIALNDLKGWSEYHAINVLYISDNDITPEDLQWLDLVPHLDYVLVNDEHTTEQLLPGLTKDLSPPGTMTEYEKVQYVDAFSLKLAPPPRFYRD